MIAAKFENIVDLQTGEVRGQEVLTRFAPQANPFLKTVVSSEFDLGCLEFCAGQSAGLQHDVYLNILPSTLGAVGAERITQALGDRHPLNRYCIEVNEEIFDSEPGDLKGVISALRTSGVRVGLDDAVEPKSVAGVLKKIAVDFVKIDRSLVAQSGTRWGLERIRGILAASGSAQVIAEGVERWRQVTDLWSVGVRRAQGYFWQSSLARAS